MEGPLVYVITYDRMTKPRDWDASTYQRLSAPMTAMGTDVLDRLLLAGDETVLDAGCGSGNVTLMLLERLPEGRVIAVDSAPSMVEHAREASSRREPTCGRRPARARVEKPGTRSLHCDLPLDPRLRGCSRTARGLKPCGGSSPSAAGRQRAAIKQAWPDVGRESPYAGTSGPGRPLAVRDAGGHGGAAARVRVHRVWCWLPRVDVARANGRLPARDLPRLVLERLPESCTRNSSRRRWRGCPIRCHPLVRLNVLARRG